LLIVLLNRVIPKSKSVTLAMALVMTFGFAACGGDTLGVATTVVNVTPTNFATIPPVASTVPGTSTTLPSNAVGSETTYTVVAGDSPLAVANKFGISLTTLLAYNGMVTPKQFPYPGQTLRIPPQAVVAPTDPNTPTATNPATPGVTNAPVGPGCGTRPAGTYAIAPNDSFFKIQKKFCVSLGALLTANNWPDSSQNLLVGQVINIPAAGS
jgi:D-gamma-glutamyl-meso-diaminopimelic acid endopeptidase CwlS